MLTLNYDESTQFHFNNLKQLTVYSQFIFESNLIAKNELLNTNLTQPTHSFNILF